MSQHQCLISESGDILGEKTTPHSSAFEDTIEGPQDRRLLDKPQFSSIYKEKSPMLGVN